VAAACLVNPYFLDGARFPFDLYPKVSESGNVYKEYIGELMSLRQWVTRSTPRVAGVNWFFLSCYFLMLLLPVSFLYPALWRAWRSATPSERPHTSCWLAGLAAVVGLAALSTAALSGSGPGWLISLGDNVPILLLIAAGLAAVLLRRTPAAGVAGAGSVFLALLVLWLRAPLLGEGRGLLAGIGLGPLTVGLVLAGLPAAALVLRWGGSLFRILVAGAFAYLALLALQNWTRFALVAGTVLSWNVGEWAWEVTRVTNGRGMRARAMAGWGLRAGLAAALGLWVVALAGDRYYSHTGEPRRFGLREQPLEFVHEAALFAGQPGLPERALVFGLGQTGVYVFHNAPRCKPFMDARLEMPARATFETYVSLIEDWLPANDPRWEKAVADMGHPLILLEHRHNAGAAAVLLTHPGWRCIYFDALASIFVARGSAGETDFPTVDFAARHFAQPPTAPMPSARGAAARELKALFNLAASLPRTAEAAWRWRIPLLLLALDRGELALEEEPQSAEVWVLLGNCYWALPPDLRRRPSSPADPWHPEDALAWAQATYCHRRAAECQPDHAAAWDALARVYRVRGMADAELPAAERWLETEPRATEDQRKQVARLRRAVELARLPSLEPHQVPALVLRLM
jgi:hypothetical protein